MSEPVSKKAQAITLQTLPLELRLRIYEFVALRPTGPRLLLKEWLEKVDPDIDTSTPPSVTFDQIFSPNGNFVDDDGDDDDGDDYDDDGSEAADNIMDEDEDEDEEDEDDAEDGEDGNVDGDDADDDLDDVDDEVRSNREKILKLNILTATCRISTMRTMARRAEPTDFSWLRGPMAQ